MVSRVRALVSALGASWLGRLLSRCGRDRIDLFAAAVAFNAIFAMFPLMFAVLAIVGFVLRSPSLRASAQETVLMVLPANLAGAISEIIDSTIESAGLFGAVSLVGLLLVAPGLFGSLEAAFGRIYRVEGRPFPRLMRMSFGMILLFGLLVILSIAVPTILTVVISYVAALPGVERVIEPVKGIGLWIIERLITAAGALGVFFAIYRIVPNRRIGVREALPGTVFAATAFYLLSLVFPAYVRLFGLSNLYGSFFGFFFVLMIWGNMFAVSVLIGCEINAQAAGEP